MTSISENSEIEDDKMKKDNNIVQTRLYFQHLLNFNGQKLQKFQNIHIMTMYFFTFGLDITNSLTEQQKEKIRYYILSLEIPSGGWTCGSFYTKYQSKTNSYDLPHIVFTYSALNTLSMVGGLNKINTEGCLLSLSKCQNSNGSYSSFSNSEQADLRFVYSAVVICHTLNDFSKMNVEKVYQYIDNCYNFDGGYGLRPFCQSHSGAIYCALASLKLLKRQPKDKKRTLNFLVNRQTFNLSANNYIGVQGRVGKYPDSCYSFWVGASINILTGKNLIHPNVENYIHLCHKQAQHSFSKYPNNPHGDPIHTAHSLVGIKIARNQFQQLDLIKGCKKH